MRRMAPIPLGQIAPVMSDHCAVLTEHGCSVQLQLPYSLTERQDSLLFFSKVRLKVCLK